MIKRKSWTLQSSLEGIFLIKFRLLQMYCSEMFDELKF